MTTPGGDPVEEAGQAVRQGFIQTFQTAAMTANLLQRRGAESRSVTEHRVRLEDREAEQWRKFQIHGLQAQGYVNREARDRQLFGLEQRIKQARLHHITEESQRKAESSKAFEERHRNTHGLQVRNLRAEHNRKDAIHTVQIRSYTKRAAQEQRRHDLDVEYKKLLIDHRRRALGLTETLTGTGEPTAAAATAAAQWAAAHSTADLSDDHQRYADAYAERYGDDTGQDPGEMIDTDGVEPAADTGQRSEGADPDPEASVESSSSNVADTMASLAEELTFGHLAEAIDAEIVELVDPDHPSDGTDPDQGGVIGAAVDAIATHTGSSSETGMSSEAPPDPPAPGRAPDAGVEP